MRKLFALIAFTVLLAGCGDGDKDPAAATPAASEEAEHDLEGYSEGVKDYYGDPHEHADTETGNVEAEYHQPPQPPVAGLGDKIVLTGSNIGIRNEVTLDEVERDGDRTNVTLSLLNTGITIYDGPLQNASLSYAGGKTVPAERTSCTKDSDPSALRIDVSASATVCLQFKTDGDKKPERLVLALEQVPTEAGGIWELG